MIHVCGKYVCLYICIHIYIYIYISVDDEYLFVYIYLQYMHTYTKVINVGFYVCMYIHDAMYCLCDYICIGFDYVYLFAFTFLDIILSMCIKVDM